MLILFKWITRYWFSLSADILHYQEFANRKLLLSIGSSNSQDSFPAAGSNSSSMDGFSNGPHVGAGPGGVPGPYPQYPPSSEYPGHMPQRTPAQSTSGKFLQESFKNCFDLSLSVICWWWEVKYAVVLWIIFTFMDKMRLCFY